MKLLKLWMRHAALLITGFIGLALIVLLLFAWWFPNLAQHRTAIENFLSQELRQPVVIQHLETEWRGLRLSFLARGVRIRGLDDTRSAMRVGELRMEVKPLPLLLGEIRLRTLTIRGLTLELIRTSDGQIRVTDLATGGPDPAAGQAALAWWFRQQDVRIGDAYIIWRDEREPQRMLQLSDVKLTMQRSGTERTLSGSARFPKELGGALDFSGTLRGIPLVEEDWGGVMEFSFARLNVTKLPLAVAELLPWQSSGRISARFSTSFVRGRPVGGVGELTVLDFEIPYHEKRVPLAAKRLQSGFSWHLDGANWRLLLLQPELELDRVLTVDQFEIDWIPDTYTFRIENVDLRETVAAIKALEIKLPWQYVLERVKPEGVVHRAKVTVTGKLNAPENWDFEGEFADLGWAPYRHFPGLSGVQGRLQLDRQHGRLKVRDGNIELDFPQVLRAPVQFPRLNGNIAWSRDEKDWSVHVTDLQLQNKDIQVSAGSVIARLPVEPGPSPYIDARARVDRVDLESVRHYLPAKLMKPKAIAWADHAFAGGKATDGRFRLRGFIKDFPFQDDSGEFRVTAKVNEGVLVYDSDWPAVTDISADVTFDNEWVRVTSDHARIYGSPVTRVVMNSNELFLKKKPKIVSIDGEMRAKVDDVVQFLTKGPLIKDQEGMPDMAGAGEGILSLKLDLPIGRLKESSQVAGTYKFEDAALKFTSNGIGVSQLAGQIAFTEKTVNGEALKGRMLDGPVQIAVHSVKPQKPPHFAIDFKGQGNVKGLAPILSHSLVGFLSGTQVPWQGRLEVDRGRADLSVRSDGFGLASTLPAPLAKAPDERWQVSARSRFTADGRDINFNVAERLRGVLAMRKRDDKIVFERGRITMNRGRAELPPDPGLQIIVSAANIDADQWIKAWRRAAEYAEKAPADEADDDNLIDHLRLFRADARAFKFLDRDLGTMQIEAHSGDSLDWVARITGPAASGAARLRFNRDDDTPHEFKFVLDRLYWPRLQQLPAADQPVENESPLEYPRLAIDAGDFRFGDWRLGRARLRAAPDADGWRIENFSTEHDALQISGSGLWHEKIPGQQTQLELEFNSKDAGRALTQLGYPDQVAGGEAALDAKLEWPGSPGQFQYAHLDGTVVLEVKKGRFLQVDPGSGRLMGLFNVDALARRLTLDFTDVFSKGLAFDRIDAKGRISQGDLFSDGIFIVGPAAMIEARGRAGLAAEDYDMELIIAPDFGGNLTLLSALANPAAGAVVFVMQKLFKKQLAKIVHYRYQVNGPWEDPHVVKLRQEPLPDAGDETIETDIEKDR